MAETADDRSAQVTDCRRRCVSGLVRLRMLAGDPGAAPGGPVADSLRDVIEAIQGAMDHLGAASGDAAGPHDALLAARIRRLRSAGDAVLATAPPASPAVLRDRVTRFGALAEALWQVLLSSPPDARPAGRGDRTGTTTST